MRRRRGRPPRREAYPGPTPETRAKLTPDPLLALLESYGGGDAALEMAAEEIRAVYHAVCGMLMAGIGERYRHGRARGGRREMPSFLAWAHAQTYLPWADGTQPATLAAVIDLVVDRRPVRPDIAPAVVAALRDYAGRMRRRIARDFSG